MNLLFGGQAFSVGSQDIGHFFGVLVDNPDQFFDLFRRNRRAFAHIELPGNLVQVTTDTQKLVVGLIQHFHFGCRQGRMLADIRLHNIAHYIVYAAAVLHGSYFQIGTVFFGQTNGNAFAALWRWQFDEFGFVPPNRVAYPSRRARKMRVFSARFY